MSSCRATNANYKITTTDAETTYVSHRLSDVTDDEAHGLALRFEDAHAVKCVVSKWDPSEYTKDCGDHSCILRDKSKPGGMRTNGGCQHLKASGAEMNAQLRAMGAEIVRLRAIERVAKRVAKVVDYPHAGDLAAVLGGGT